jgi:hypothetical protein
MEGSMLEMGIKSIGRHAEIRLVSRRWCSTAIRGRAAPLARGAPSIQKPIGSCCSISADPGEARRTPASKNRSLHEHDSSSPRRYRTLERAPRYRAVAGVWRVVGNDPVARLR